MRDRQHPLTSTGARQLLATFAIVFALCAGLLASSPSAGVAQPIAEISELDCEGNPELVVVTNVGTEPLQMSGWNLQSDPPDKESLPLGVLGSLSPGESVMVESGPASEAAFTWSRKFVFRDNDPTEYVRLASDEGVVLLQLNCDGTTPTPTPASTPTPSPTPAALRATSTPLSGVVPDGGGPPGGSIGLPSPILVAAMGGSLTVGGLALLLSPLLAALFAAYRRRGAAAAAGTLAGPAPAPVVTITPRHQDGSVRPLLLVCIAALSAVVVMILLFQPGDEH